MPRSRTAPMGTLIDAFLTNKKTNSKPATFNIYETFLREFRIKHGDVLVTAINSTLLRNWIETRYKDCSNSTKRMAARAVLAVLHFAFMEGVIDKKPIRGFIKAPDARREVVLTPAQYALMLRMSKGATRTAVKFLWHTGCRPHEFRLLDSRWWHGKTITLPRDIAKTKRRNIYLDDMALGLVTRLSPPGGGVIFRDDLGRPWEDHTLVYRFRLLRLDTGIRGLVPYTMRHSWITRLLERGLDVASIAELARTSPRMILETYNHVGRNEARLVSLL